MTDGEVFLFLICIYFLRYFSGHHTPPRHTRKLLPVFFRRCFFRLLTDNFIARPASVVWMRVTDRARQAPETPEC